MVGVNFHRIPVKSERFKEINDLKDRIEKIGIKGLTYDEAIALLLEKDRRLKMSEKDVGEIMKHLRGIR